MEPPTFVLTASMPRRVFGTAMLGGLGLLLVWMALATNPAFPWRVALVAVGAGALWLARGLWLSTAGHVVLTGEGLVDQDGRVLAAMDDIAEVDRSAFAFKPSNGLLVKLKGRAVPGWAPGLWWRYGRRLGIGGVTASGDGRAMADLLKALMVERR